VFSKVFGECWWIYLVGILIVLLAGVTTVMIMMFQNLFGFNHEIYGISKELITKSYLLKNILWMKINIIFIHAKIHLPFFVANVGFFIFLKTCDVEHTNT
jgi:hypothetical protein